MRLPYIATLCSKKDLRYFTDSVNSISYDDALKKFRLQYPADSFTITNVREYVLKQFIIVMYDSRVSIDPGIALYSSDDKAMTEWILNHLKEGWTEKDLYTYAIIERKENA
jgi:hypothetical protein